PACHFDWIVWNFSPTPSEKAGRLFHVFKYHLARMYFLHMFCWALRQRGTRKYACVEFFLPCELRATPRAATLTPQSCRVSSQGWQGNSMQPATAGVSPNVVTPCE
ncbi:hypothetical protein TcCL_NonESM10773, partial [Trypanosoma cruzi]